MRPVPLSNGQEDLGRPDTAQVSQAVLSGEPDALRWALAYLLDAVDHEARHGYPMSQRLEVALQLGASAIAADAQTQEAVVEGGRRRRKSGGTSAWSPLRRPRIALRRSATTKAGSTAGA
jgi:hypothetical protein